MLRSIISRDRKVILNGERGAANSFSLFAASGGFSLLGSDFLLNHDSMMFHDRRGQDSYGACL